MFFLGRIKIRLVAFELHILKHTHIKDLVLKAGEGKVSLRRSFAFFFLKSSFIKLVSLFFLGLVLY